MDIDQIRYFLAVSRSLSFERAAEECYVSQPSLTRALKALEDEFGGDLFRRDHNPCHLTDFGHRLLPVLQRCYDSGLQAKAAAKTWTRSGGAALSIGVARSVNLDLLQGPLERTAREFPCIEVTMHRASIADLIELLKLGEIDCAIAQSLEDNWIRFESWPIANDQSMLVAHRTHALAKHKRVSISALAGERLFALEGCMWADEIARQLGDNRLDLQQQESVGDLLAMVQIDCGLAIVPANAPLTRDLVAVEVDSIDLVHQIGLHAIVGRSRSAAMCALLKSVRQFAACSKLELAAQQLAA